MFDWRRYISVEVAEATDRATIESALDSIASVPKGRELIEAAHAGKLATARWTADELSKIDEVGVEPINPMSLDSARRPDESGQELAFGAALAKFRSRIAEGSGEGGIRVAIRDGETNAFHPDSFNIDFNAVELKTEYMGRDGGYHANTVVRAIGHEIGHATQDRTKQKELSEKVADACILTDRFERHAPPQGDSPFSSMGWGAGGPGDESVVVESPPARTAPKAATDGWDIRGATESDRCKSAKGDLARYRLEVIEQNNVDLNENVLMQQIDPSQVARGNYAGSRVDGRVQPIFDLGEISPSPTPRPNDADRQRPQGRH